MCKYLFVIVLALFPGFIFAQLPEWRNDSTAKILINSECGEIVFTRSEKDPSLNVSNREYEDSLTDFLKAGNAFYDGQIVCLAFVLTRHSRIVDMVVLSGSYENESVLKGAIVHFSNLLNPALQNGHMVCVYAKIQIDIAENKLHVRLASTMNKFP